MKLMKFVFLVGILVVGYFVMKGIEVFVVDVEVDVLIDICLIVIVLLLILEIIVVMLLFYGEVSLLESINLVV